MRVHVWKDKRFEGCPFAAGGGRCEGYHTGFEAGRRGGLSDGVFGLVNKKDLVAGFGKWLNGDLIQFKAREFEDWKKDFRAQIIAEEAGKIMAIEISKAPDLNRQLWEKCFKKEKEELFEAGKKELAGKILTRQKEIEQEEYSITNPMLMGADYSEGRRASAWRWVDGLAKNNFKEGE